MQTACTLSRTTNAGLILFIVLICSNMSHSAKNSPREYHKYFIEELRETQLASDAKIPDSRGWLSSLCCCGNAKQQKCEKSARGLQERLKEVLGKLDNSIDAYEEYTKYKTSELKAQSLDKQERVLRKEIEALIAQSTNIRDEMWMLFPKIISSLSTNEHPDFVIRDFGGGGHCFFYSLAAILRQLDGEEDAQGKKRTQQWVRDQMASYLLNKTTGLEKAQYKERIDLLKFDDVSREYYDGVETLDDLALRIRNAGKFDGVYEGDQLSKALAEKTFDISLLTINKVKADIAKSEFKGNISTPTLRNRFAFLRHTGDDSGGHYQVHAYKGAGLGFYTQDLRSLPTKVKQLADTFLKQFGLATQYTRSCRPKAGVCEYFDNNENKCKETLVGEANLCVWTGPSRARCEGNAGCTYAGQSGICEKVFDAKDRRVCLSAQDHCLETRSAKAEVGCRDLAFVTQTACEDIQIFNKEKGKELMPYFCSYIPGAKSSCTPKVAANPCATLGEIACEKENNCEWR